MFLFLLIRVGYCLYRVDVRDEHLVKRGIVLHLDMNYHSHECVRKVNMLSLDQATSKVMLDMTGHPC